MNGFRRFLLAVYAICGLALVAVLGLSWYGPFTSEVRNFLSNNIVYTVVFGVMVVVVIGLIVQLIRAIISRRVSAVNVAIVDGGQIAVTCDAIASTASNIVEQNSMCRVDDVKVKARGKNRVNVRMRLAPYSATDIYDGGSALHGALMDGLGNLCGDALQSVSLQFVEPQTPDLTPHDAMAANQLGEPQDAWQGEQLSEAPEYGALPQAAESYHDYTHQAAEPVVEPASEPVSYETQFISTPSGNSDVAIHVETSDSLAVEGEASDATTVFASVDTSTQTLDEEVQ
ncbi:MAG: hypothetical protein IJ125_03510 [Atopobiaceae bacterium]|nr:hypothetical protein [Atopobiaceae bacterium]